MKNDRLYGRDPETGEECFHLTTLEVVAIIIWILMGVVLDIYLFLLLLSKLKILGLG